MKQVDVTYSKIVSKLQILSDKGDIMFHIDQKRKMLPFLVFPRAAILDFMTSLPCPIVSHKRTSYHGSYNLEKVLNFGSRLEKSFNLVKVLEKYLISLLALEKSLKVSNLSTPDHFWDELDDFAKENLITIENGRCKI